MQNNLSPAAAQVMQSLQGFTEGDDALEKALDAASDYDLGFPFKPAKTGKAATQSFADVWKREQKRPDEERFLPVQSRAARRAQKAREAKAQARGQRDWRRRERLKEIATSDLANLFNIVDGFTPARPQTVELARQRIDARVADLRGDRGPDEVYAELRMLAKTARTVASKSTTPALLEV